MTRGGLFANIETGFPSLEILQQPEVCGDQLR